MRATSLTRLTHPWLAFDGLSRLFAAPHFISMLSMSAWRPRDTDWYRLRTRLTFGALHLTTWLVLVDAIFYGLWTNLLVRSRNGQKPVTNAWRVWSLTFILRVNTSNIVMWELQHNNADWDWFTTLILQETLKTQSRLQVEFCAFSEAEHLCL